MTTGAYKNASLVREGPKDLIDKRVITNRKQMGDLHRCEAYEA